MGVTGQIPGQGQAKFSPATQLWYQLTGATGGRAPQVAPGAAAASGGQVDGGTHVYAVAFVYGQSITPPGPSSAAVTMGSGNNTGSLTAIPTGGAGCTARVLYRSKAGQTVPLYVCGILNDNTTTTFTDATADSDLGDPAYVFMLGDDWLQTLQLAANVLAAAAGLIVGPAGTQITNLQVYAQALTPAAVGANTTAEQTFTVTGLTTADKILFVNKPTAQAGLGIVGMRVSGANTLAITFSNNTGAGITTTAGETYLIGAIRS